MTPGARVAAAIEILDEIKQGAAAEQALTAWARSRRFAGSKDRAAIRDHVFDVLRARRSLGDGTGREMMIRLLARDGAEVDAHFSGQGHAPPPLSDAERAALAQPSQLSKAAARDMPDWLWRLWVDSLGIKAEEVALALQTRANVFLRVNQRRTTVADAVAALATENIMAQAHPTVAGCLRVTQNARRVKVSNAFAQGLVELQDASSQFAVAAVPVPPAAQVLDYCAGGGGKALAFADQFDALIFAHDIEARRMADLPARAARAQVAITQLATAELQKHAPFDVVFCDAPCSGSGTWRRAPDAKWNLTPERLTALTQMQREVLDAAAPLVKDTGLLAYATCSVLRDENDAAIAGFLQRHPGWQVTAKHQLLPDADGDGFFLCIMVHK